MDYPYVIRKLRLIRKRNITIVEILHNSHFMQRVDLEKQQKTKYCTSKQYAVVV